MREGVDSKLYRPAFIKVETGGVVYEQCLTFTVVQKKKSSARLATTQQKY
ncbi:hypothetical protein MGI18_11550 [Bacillus sp. OVS6]|nr:hypothetical protein MGI18_11550 [Bacillus sp. OVS6]